MVVLVSCSTSGKAPAVESVADALGNQQFHIAISKLDTLIELFPDSARFYYLRGYAYDQQHQYQEGIRDFTTAIKLNPGCIEAWNNRGYAYYLTNHLRLAERDYTQAIRLDPSFSPTYGNRALLYVATGKYKPAVQDVDHALNLGDSLNSTYYNLKGYCEFQLGYSSSAIRTLKSALRLDPTYLDAANHLKEAKKALTDSSSNQSELRCNIPISRTAFLLEPILVTPINPQ